MTYWLVLVVISWGAGTVIDLPRVPTPVATQMLHVGNFPSQSDCMAAADGSDQA